MMQKEKKVPVESLKTLLCSFPASYFVLENLRINVNWTTLALAVLLIYALFTIPCELKLNKKDMFLFGIFAILLAIANNLGSHIHIEQSPYTDLRTQSYLTDYGWNDIVGIPVMVLLIYQGLKQALCWIPRGGQFCKHKGLLKSRKIPFWIPMAILIVCWLPYLILYYPGFILGDSISSIYQAMGTWGLSNHHSLMYTLFIRLSITIGNCFGNLSLGIGIYSCLQILYVAFAISKLLEWLSGHKCPFLANCFFIILYAVMPFFGQVSVAVWKDPGFGASVVLWTLCILEYWESAKEEDKKAEKKYFGLGIITTLLVCFLRNNGAYALLFFTVVLCLEFLLNRDEIKKVFPKLLVSSVAVLCIYFVVTGPVYSYFQITASSAAESVGVPLNQMASVVASPDGVMSEEDREYMNQLLPIELYSETYRPCVVDPLKWNEHFSGDYLNSHMKDFFKTYLSMGLKNPGQYMEAWALMTFGYWAPNRWEFCNDVSNLSNGNFNDMVNFGMNAYIQQVDMNNLPDNVLYKLFPNSGTVIPLALVNWLVLLAIVLALLAGDSRTVLALAPSLGIIATLLIAAPYYYWPRYGMAQFYLIPLYLYLAVSCMMKYKCQRDTVS